MAHTKTENSHVPSNFFMRARIYSFLVQKKLSPIKKLFSLAVWSTLSTVTLAAFAVKVSIDQLDANNTTSAKGVYKDYLSLALANPECAGASYPLYAPRYSHFKYGSNQREAYEFFVSLLLHSVDEILSTPEKKHWRKTLIMQLSYHALYLNTREFGSESYLCETRDLVVLGIEAYAESQYEYSSAMNPIRLDKKIRCTEQEWRKEESEQNE